MTPGILPGWATLPPAARDAAYNNAAAAADLAGHRARRLAASAAARARPGGLLDLRYGPRPAQRIDLFPAAAAAAPCFVFLFGGYWQMNGKDDFTAVADGVRALGWSAALPGYSLAPAVRLADIVAEVRAALDWLAAEGPAHGIAGPPIIAGWSAGGHLAATALDHPAVAAGLALSGIFELAPLRDTYLNDKLRLSETEIATLSPLRRPPVPRPLLIAYGADELPALVENSRAFHAHRRRAGAPGPLLALEGCDHFAVLEDLQRPDGLLPQALHRLAAGIGGR